MDDDPGGQIMGRIFYFGKEHGELFYETSRKKRFLKGNPPSGSLQKGERIYVKSARKESKSLHCSISPFRDRATNRAAALA